MFVIRPIATAAAVNKALKLREKKDRKNEAARLKRLAAKQAKEQQAKEAAQQNEANKHPIVKRAERIKALTDAGVSYGVAVTRVDREIARENSALIIIREDVQVSA